MTSFKRLLHPERGSSEMSLLEGAPSRGRESILGLDLTKCSEPAMTATLARPVFGPKLHSQAVCMRQSAEERGWERPEDPPVSIEM